MSDTPKPPPASPQSPPGPPAKRPENLTAEELAAPPVELSIDLRGNPVGGKGTELDGLVMDVPPATPDARLNEPELYPPLPPEPGETPDAPQPTPAQAAAPALAPPPPPAPKPTPEWKVLEPEDPSDPVEHEVYEARPGRPGWQVVAASVRGKLHAHKAQWREDSHKWGTADGWTILAVSDGAGSAKLSRVASRVACETAVASLRQLLAGYTVGAGGQQPADGDLQRLRSLLADAGAKARTAVMAESQRRAVPLKEFSATLLLFAHTAWQDRDLVVALQVGDGAIGLLTATGPKRLGTSDHGEYSSETRFLTTPGMELEFHNRVIFGIPVGLTAIALMTDGVSDDFYPEDKRIGEVFDANPIEGLVAKGGGSVSGLMHGVAKEPRGGEALRDWLRYEKRGSSDDRTLVLMHRSKS